MELLVLIGFLMLDPLLRRAARRLEAAAFRDRAFEAALGRRPVVVAVRCRAGQRARVEGALAALVARAQGFVNREGPTPWPYYRVRLALVAVDERTLAVEVRRGQAWLAIVEGAPLLEALGVSATLAAGVEEVWVSGEWTPRTGHAGPFERATGTVVHALGRFERGRLRLAPHLGPPPWAPSLAGRSLGVAPRDDADKAEGGGPYRR